MISKLKKKKLNSIPKNKKIKILLFLLCFLMIFINGNIKVMYFNSTNLGDNLNFILLKKISSKNIDFYDIRLNNKLKTEYERKMEKLKEIAKTDLLFIGSILQVISNWSYIYKSKNNQTKSPFLNLFLKIHNFFHPLIIYGTGFISKKNENESYIRNIKIVAVRGNVTLQRLLKNGIKVSNSVVLADPGLLLPIIFHVNESTITKKIHELCIIPHYIDKHNILVKKKIRINNYFILDINSNPLNFISSLSKCKRVLSSSLHGLIISDSLGIPNMRFVVSNRIAGGDYKFKDYYSAYGLELPQKLDLRNTTFTEKKLDIIDKNYKIPIELIKKKQCQLLKNFPYKLNEEFIFFKKSCHKSIFL